MSLSSKQLLESPDFYPLRFDGPNLLFVRMSRSSYQQSIFTLPNRIVQDGNDTWSVPFAQVMELVASAEPLQSPAFIFQIAHCGSTLLSRALDKLGASLVIREPFALRQFAAMPQTGDRNNRRGALAALLYLYSRKYQQNETVLIKANVPVNYCLTEIRELVPDSRAIFLYSNFDDYLMGVIKSQKRREWAGRVVDEMAPRIQRLKEITDVDVNSLIPVKATALLWLSQLAYYRDALDHNLQSHAWQNLNSESLFTDPTAVLHAARSHLRIDIGSADIENVVASELFKRHAKNPERPFSEEQRVAELARLKGRYKTKIEDTLSWCERLDFDVAGVAKGLFANRLL